MNLSFTRKWPNIHSAQKLVVSDLLVQSSLGRGERLHSNTFAIDNRKHPQTSLPIGRSDPRNNSSDTVSTVRSARGRQANPTHLEEIELVWFCPLPSGSSQAEDARALTHLSHLSRTGSVPVVKSSLAPTAPSVVRAVHQDESPGRRLFYYANTRRFHASHAKRGRSVPSPSFATHRRSHSSKKRSNIRIFSAPRHRNTVFVRLRPCRATLYPRFGRSRSNDFVDSSINDDRVFFFFFRTIFDCCRIWSTLKEFLHVKWA